MRKGIIRIFATMAVTFLVVSALRAGGEHNRFEVNSTIPTNRARGVPTDQVLTATFNQDVDCSTVTTSSFTLREDRERRDSEWSEHKGHHGAAAGVVACSGTVATFTPDTDLAANTDYAATITDGVKDVKGQTLECAFVWRFRTGSKPTPPTVTAVAPRNKARGVVLNTKITAAFDQAMDAGTINGSTFELTGPGTTPVSGVITYDTTNNVATFTPNAPLKGDTLYTATVTTGVTNLCGTAMAANFVWRFTTGAAPHVTPPTVISTIPVNGASGVPLNQIISATFSEAIDCTTVTTSSFTLTDSSGAVAGTVACSGATATFTPSADLAANSTYTATITTGVAELSCNHLVTKYVWSFTTGAAIVTTPPTVVLTSPVSNATGVCTNAAIIATFSEPMDPATINTGTFTVTTAALVPVTGTVSLDVTGTIATYMPSGNLATSTSYIVTITTGVTDLLGIPLASDEIWSFTTGATACVTPGNLGTAATFGAFGGGAGMTNTGINTVINGDIGTTAASTTVTGFHDTTSTTAYNLSTGAGCIYTETLSNIGDVTGEIYTAPPPPTLTCPDEGTATTFAIATEAAADALTAWNALKALPAGPYAGAGQLGGLTLTAGTYTSPTSFMITGSPLTLSGSATDVWVFQMASSLTVGAAAAPQSVILTGGARRRTSFGRSAAPRRLMGRGAVPWWEP